jgi:acyl carrier protein phosphodiesterase
MNYLAHLFLSHQTPDAIAGAMLGDFVKGRPSEQWGPAVRRAIVLHRAIDRYTDHHDIVRAARALVSRERRRFAGIMVDMYYDHFLARHWQKYHARPLREFTGGIYRVLLARRGVFPERLQRMLPWMVQDDWLASYAEPASIDAALNGLVRRFRAPERAATLKTAIDELHGHYAEFEAGFLDFFPQLQGFVVDRDPP